MLKITLEIIPFGDTTLTRTIGSITISNVGGTVSNGHYEYKMDQGPTIGHLRNFQRSKGAWALVSEVLKKFTASHKG